MLTHWSYKKGSREGIWDTTPPPAPQKNPRPYIPHTPDSHRIKGAWMFDSWCVVIQFQFGLVSLFSRLLSLNYYSGLRNIKCLALKWIQFYVYFGGGEAVFRYFFFFCSVNQTWKYELISCRWICFEEKLCHVPHSCNLLFLTICCFS